MFDWFWDLQVMRDLQGLADRTRAMDIDPVWALIFFVAVGLFAVWRMNQPATTRDTKPMGGHYLGKLTPKSLARMAQSPERKRIRTRKEAEAAVARAAARRRKAEARERK